MKTVTAVLLAILFTPALPGAQDKWLGADKAKHFAAGAGIAAGSYTASVPLTRRKGVRIAIGTTVGLGVAGGKELADRSRGTPSWRDFTWAAAGTATGVLVTWTIDKLTD
ncbi:MAG TPA: hypothetical protein VJM31_02875 [Vicinamibacterales bacterium]|nr:hypothetical protein [Vicinamibacterales bacterium]